MDYSFNPKWIQAYKVPFLGLGSFRNGFLDLSLMLLKVENQSEAFFFFSSFIFMALLIRFFSLSVQQRVECNNEP